MIPSSSSVTRPSSADFLVCRKLQQKHGTSYALATRFFPEEKRLATEALYAFFRVPDDLVDIANPNNQEQAEQALKRFAQACRNASDTRHSTAPTSRCTARAFRRFATAMEHGEASHEAKAQDVTIKGYEAAADLER